MTHQAFVESFAISQFVPGPNMLIVFLIGYRVAAWPGALAAGLGNVCSNVSAACGCGLVDPKTAIADLGEAVSCRDRTHFDWLNCFCNVDFRTRPGGSSISDGGVWVCCNRYDSQLVVSYLADRFRHTDRSNPSNGAGVLTMANFDWVTVPSLTTDRLELRSLTSKDKHDLFQIYGDPEVMRFASDPAFPDESYVDQMLESVNQLFANRESLEWGIVVLEADHHLRLRA